MDLFLLCFILCVGNFMHCTRDYFYVFACVLGHFEWSRGKVKIELYHLIDDPMEKNDLSSREPERTAKMLLSLEIWQRSVLRSWSGRDY